VARDPSVCSAVRSVENWVRHHISDTKQYDSFYFPLQWNISGHDPKTNRVGYAMEKMALGQDLLQVFLFPSDNNSIKGSSQVYRKHMSVEKSVLDRISSRL